MGTAPPIVKFSVFRVQIIAFKKLPFEKDLLNWNLIKAKFIRKEHVNGPHLEELVLVEVKVVKVEKVELQRLVDGIQTVQDGDAVFRPSVGGVPACKCSRLVLFIATREEWFRKDIYHKYERNVITFF